jgi:single-strand DNA-binding protein
MRYMPNGAPICTFPVAINSKRKDADGKPVDHVDFFRITAKFKLAEVCAKYLKSGRPVYVSGKLESWKSDGKFGINFVAEDVQFLGSAKGGDAVPAQGAVPAAPRDEMDAETRQWLKEFDGDMPN